MNVLRDLIHRLRQGESQRAVARDLGLSRLTVGKYAAQARAAGYLDEATPVPAPSTLATVLARGGEVPRQPSSVQPHQSVVDTPITRLGSQNNYCLSKNLITIFKIVSPGETKSIMSQTLGLYCSPNRSSEPLGTSPLL